MKKVLLYLFIFASYCPIFGYVDCEKLAGQEEKHYIQADQIVLSDEGIIIISDDMDLIASSIFHDCNGYYYLEEGVMWRCRNCGALNDLDNSECYRCHEPY